MTECLTCKMIEQRETETVPLWDNIYRTKHWDVVHSYNTSLLGWLVLVVRRHIRSLDELTEEEAIEFGQLIRYVSIALKQTTDCLKTYVVQFADNPDHSHVHCHIIPRMPDWPKEQKAKEVFKYLNVPEAERVSDEDMTKLSQQIRTILAATNL